MKSTVFLRIAISAALFTAAFAIYAQTLRFEFVNFDDPELYESPHVQHGLSAPGLRWAFSSLHVGNYLPVTLLTYLADFERAGFEPGAYHFTNVLFHAATSALLFLALHALTRGVWPSALAAALFAVHPLHVESVAWVSERKDVVSAFFAALTLWAYAAYVRAPRASRYLLMTGLFALGLLAKSMLVTLPCVLLLLDGWPLGRAPMRREARRAWARLFFEKVPLFGLTVLLSIVTIAAQRSANALPDAGLLTFPARLANAVVSYMRYLHLTIWPDGLIPYYPHPKDSLSIAQVAVAGTILALFSAAAWGLRRRAPYVLIGWLWYVGTLVPVIGLVQVGAQAMADRYTYIPHIGLFMAVSWGLAEPVGRFPRARIPLALASLAAVAALGWAAHAQAARWRDSITLYEYTLGVSPRNVVILGNLGEAYVAAGRHEDAIRVIQGALALDPVNTGNLRNLGHALRKLGRYEEGLLALRKAVELNPNDAGARSDYALGLYDIHQDSSAYREFHRAIELDPGLFEARVGLGNWYLRAHYFVEAEEQYAAALRIRPRSAEAIGNMGTLHLVKGEYGRAQARFLEALELAPEDPVFRTNLAVALKEAGDTAGARREAELALRHDAAYGKARALIDSLDASPAP